MDEKLLDEYKKLVFKREKLRKDAQMYWIDYIMEFGELIEKECALKIDCIKLKKMIAFCQARKNRGETIFRAELDLYIESVMKDYNTELQTIADIRNAKKETVSEIDYYKLKKLYRQLATMLHPDLHPALFEHEEIVTLWERISSAYKCNDYAELQALEILAVDAVNRYEKEERVISVDNVQAKTLLLKTEINEIIHTDPYRYKELLRDADAVAEKKKELQDSIYEYELYLSELNEEANKYTVEGYA